MRISDDQIMAAVAALTGAHFTVRSVTADVGRTMLVRLSITGRDEVSAFRVLLPSGASEDAPQDEAAAAAARLRAVVDDQVTTGCARWAARTRRGDDQVFVPAPYGFRRADEVEHRRMLKRVGAVDPWRDVYDVRGASQTPAGRKLARLATLPFSYPDVGATRGEMPLHHRAVHVAQRIGVGRAWFRTASERLMSWDMHRRASLLVHAEQRVTLGGVALLDVRIGPWWLAAPVWVVEMVAEPTVAGFAYGRLPGPAADLVRRSGGSPPAGCCNSALPGCPHPGRRAGRRRFRLIPAAFVTGCRPL